jgi:hypothetical protein
MNENPILHKKFKNHDHNIIIIKVISNIPRLNVCKKLIINAIIATTKYNIAGVHIFCESAILYNNMQYFIFIDIDK